MKMRMDAIPDPPSAMNFRRLIQIFPNLATLLKVTKKIPYLFAAVLAAMLSGRPLWVNRVDTAMQPRRPIHP